MRFFQRKRAVYHLNTKDKQTPMEGGIIDQLEDSPSKMTTRLKRVGAFLRGCIYVATGCFHGIRPTQKTEDPIDVYGIYRRCSSYGRLAPVSETECELHIQSPPKCDFEIEILPESDIVIETPPESDIKIETPPESDVEVETLPESDIKIETPPESDIEIETPPESDVEIETPPESDIETFPSTREIVPTILDNFRFHRFLGAGSFGKVVLASHISNDELLALKIITKDNYYVNEILNESRILQEVRTSPFCTHAYGAFKTKDKVVFAMEYLSGGDLMDFIRERAPLDFATIRFLTAEILCGLRFLHNHGIVHRDLKPDNIMLDSVGHVRIADFGLSAIGVGSDKALDDSVGTPMYRAPEIYLELSYGYAADYFSLGVIVYMMATGYYPFMGLDANMLACSILNQRPPFPKDFNMDLKDLIGNILLCEWQDMRAMLCENLQSHPFFMDVDWKEMEAGEVSPPFTMNTCPPIDLTTEIKLEEIIPPPEEQWETESTEEDQELYCGFSFTNSRWGEVQRPQMLSALPAEELPVIKSQQ